MDNDANPEPNRAAAGRTGTAKLSRTLAEAVAWAGVQEQTNAMIVERCAIQTTARRHAAELYSRQREQQATANLVREALTDMTRVGWHPIDALKALGLNPQQVAA